MVTTNSKNVAKRKKNYARFFSTSMRSSIKKKKYDFSFCWGDQSYHNRQLDMRQRIDYIF